MKPLDAPRVNFTISVSVEMVCQPDRLLIQDVQVNQTKENLVPVATLVLAGGMISDSPDISRKQWTDQSNFASFEQIDLKSIGYVQLETQETSSVVKNDLVHSDILVDRMVFPMQISMILTGTPLYGEHPALLREPQTYV